jgi:hypothetical protein
VISPLPPPPQKKIEMLRSQGPFGEEDEVRSVIDVAKVEEEWLSTKVPIQTQEKTDTTKKCIMPYSTAFERQGKQCPRPSCCGPCGNSLLPIPKIILLSTWLTFIWLTALLSPVSRHEGPYKVGIRPIMYLI